MLREAVFCHFAEPWDRLRHLSVEDLPLILANERNEGAKVLWSKFELAKVTGIVGMLGGEHAHPISHAVCMNARVTPDALDRIAQSSLAQID